MSGYQMILKIRRLEEECNILGFRLGHPKHGGFGRDNLDEVALFPRDEELPVYCRDAEIFTGTLSQLEVWLRGLKWARDYDMLMRVSDDKKRSRKEQDERNKQMMQRIKQEELALKGK